MYFRQVLHEEKSCASYLVGCPTYGPCAVIETHVHADHLSCARDLASLAGAPLFLGSGHYSGSVCGRGMDGKPVSTIGRERGRNKALRLDRAQFIDFQCSNPPPLPPDFHRIKTHNLGQA